MLDGKKEQSLFFLRRFDLLCADICETTKLVSYDPMILIYLEKAQI